MARRFAFLLLAAIPLGAAAEEKRAPQISDALFAQTHLLTTAARAGDRIVAAGQFGHIIFSDDSGKTWRVATDVPTQTTLTALHFPTPLIGYAVGYDAVILKTQDGGNTWKQVYKDPETNSPDANRKALTDENGDSCARKPEPDQCRIPFLAVYFRTPEHGLAMGAFSLVMETRDGGDTWRWRALAPGHDDDLHLNGLFADGRGILYAPSEFGIVYRSADGGRTFRAVETSYEGSFWGGLALGDSSVLLHGMRGSAYRSDNAGRSWKRIPTDADQSFHHAIRLKNGTIVMTGLSGVVAQSSDNGQSFSAANRPQRLGYAALAEGGEGEVVLFGERGVAHHALRPAGSLSP